MLQWKPRYMLILAVVAIVAQLAGLNHGWFQPFNHGW